MGGADPELNARLGAVGVTVSYIEMPYSESSSTEALRTLVAAMAAGRVQTLVMLGGNPVYNAPGDLDFAQALKVAGSSRRFHHSWELCE